MSATRPEQAKNQTFPASCDLELIAQRILKLAEIGTLEHLEALAGSQARELVELATRFEIGHAN